MSKFKTVYVIFFRDGSTHEAFQAIYSTKEMAVEEVLRLNDTLVDRKKGEGYVAIPWPLEH